VLEEVHEMTMRIERLSQSEHDLISDVHPQVSEIKEQAKTLEKLFRPKELTACQIQAIERAGLVAALLQGAGQRNA
jgi:hypothetical protein